MRVKSLPRVPRHALSGNIISPPKHWAPGKKQLYLPNVCISLLRNDKLPATQAHFSVPLEWTKLDIKDYLFHAYGVSVHRVRSYIKQRELVLKYNMPGRRKRLQSLKYMIVELKEPFVYPEVPEDITPWSTTGTDTDGHMENNEKEVTEELERSNETALPPKNEVGKMAQLLLQGKIKWQPGWKALGSS